MDNFDLKKYLIENKVTTNSRMLRENAGTEIVEIFGGGRGGLDYSELIKTDKSFEQFCEEKAREILEDLLHDPQDPEGDEKRAEYAKEFKVGELVFNSSKTVCETPASEETGYIWVDANKINPEIKEKLLDEDTDSDEIYDIVDNLD
jgi:hypothetical protein